VLKFLLSGLVTPVIKQILLFAIFTASLLPGKAFGSGQDDQLQAMRRNSDLRRIENDRVLEELSRKTQWDKSRAVVYAAKKRFTDKGLPGRVSFFSTSATLRGTVSDDDGNPISDVEVSADFEGEGGTWTKTGTDGSYEMTVEAGKVKLRLNENDLIPTYLRPKEKEVTVEDDTATTVDFTAYASDATISGMVLLDGTLLSKVGVSAEGKTGWTRTETASDGTFTLQVASEADATGGGRSASSSTAAWRRSSSVESVAPGVRSIRSTTAMSDKRSDVGAADPPQARVNGCRPEPDLDGRWARIRISQWSARAARTSA